MPRWPPTPIPSFPTSMPSWCLPGTFTQSGPRRAALNQLLRRTPGLTASDARVGLCLSIRHEVKLYDRERQLETGVIGPRHSTRPCYLGAVTGATVHIYAFAWARSMARGSVNAIHSNA